MEKTIFKYDDADQLLKAFKDELKVKKGRNKVRTTSQSRRLHLDCCGFGKSFLAMLCFGKLFINGRQVPLKKHIH